MPAPPLTMPLLVGDGVVLRAWSTADVPLIQEASRDPVIPGYTTVPRSPDREAAEAFVERQHGRSRDGEGWSFAIADPSTDEAVGQIGLWLYDLSRGALSVGYWVVDRHRGHGIAGRALSTLVEFAVTVPEVFRIELQVEPHNLASRRTAERVGFEREGLLVDWLDVDGERRDVLAYALIPRLHLA
ncbi:MAG: GNAT family protein [Solirubrobacteraceae bacterium]|nr:GNAT family protein [Patulibacter sp.]